MRQVRYALQQASSATAAMRGGSGDVTSPVMRDVPRRDAVRSAACKCTVRFYARKAAKSEKMGKRPRASCVQRARPRKSPEAGAQIAAL